jgi:hypothetical protein
MKKRFIPDCEVVTATETYRGMLLEVDADGNVKMELKPGVIKSIAADDIRTRKPIRDPNED